MMIDYVWLKWWHVLSGFGYGVALTIILMHHRLTGRSIHRLFLWLATPLFFVVLSTGSWMAGIAHFSWAEPWMHGALSLLLLSWGLMGTYTRLSRSWDRWMPWFQAAMMAGILGLMVLRPEL
jgi:hypothetical protein